MKLKWAPFKQCQQLCEKVKSSELDDTNGVNATSAVKVANDAPAISEVIVTTLVQHAHGNA